MRILAFLLLAALARAQVKVSLLHFNDFHARFEPISKSGGSCKPGENEQGLCFGGIARLFSALEEKRNSMTNPIVLNAGDNYQGSLLYSLFKWNITLEFMSKFNLDASAFGNHEFDDKVAGIVPYAYNLGSPLVAANMDASLEPTLDGKFTPSVTITRGGKKIGIIGCISRNTPAMSSPQNVQFSDEIPAVTAEAAKLKSQGVDIIILLSHSGYGVDLQMAEEIPDLDIVVGAHSHTFLYTGTPPATDIPEGEYPTVVTQGDGHRTLVVQAMAFGKYLGVLEVDFDSAGEVSSWTGNPILLDGSVTEEPTMLAQLKPWTDEANVIGQKTLGSSAVLLDNSNCYDQECNLGNFLADAMVHEHTEVAEDEGWTMAAIAIMNPGGLRAPMGESSNVTVNDLIAAQPFQNTIDTIELQGKDIVELMEMAASPPAFQRRFKRFGEGKGCFQVSGILATYDLARPEGSRMIDIKLRCARCRIPQFFPVDPEEWYNVAMPSFLSGGSSFPLIVERGRNLKVGRIDSEIFAGYITKESPIVTANEGRIIVV